VDALSTLKSPFRITTAVQSEKTLSEKKQKIQNQPALFTRGINKKQNRSETIFSIIFRHCPNVYDKYLGWLGTAHHQQT